MKISVGILDDDLFFVSVLEEKVKVFFEKYELDAEIDCFTEAEQLEGNSTKYDLVFMDIVMPESDGISLAETWQSSGRVRDVIYVSAHDREVFRTFGSKPVAYVRKTQMDEDLEQAMALYHEHLKTLRVIIPEGKKKHLMRVDDIIYVSSQNHYVEFHMWDGDTIIMRSKLDKMEGVLRRYGFVRVHVSYLINMKYVCSLDRSQIYLKNNQSYRISVKYKKHVFEMLKDNFVEIGNEIGNEIPEEEY